MSLSDISIKFNETVLEDIVKKCGGVKILAFRFLGGFKKGDSYLSEVFRLQIDAERENGETFQVTTVIKSIPTNVAKRKTFRSDDFFRNEINFYEQVMKGCLDNQVKNAVVGKDQLFNAIPRCLASFINGINDFIVLEDLGQDGFGTVNRQIGMDFNHVKIAIQTLGKFHAMSLAFRYQQPKEFEKILEFVEETYYADKFHNWYRKVQNDQIITAIDAVEKEYPGTEVEAKAKSFITSNLFEKLVAMTHFTNEYSVINHGDCWTPNFLFKYDPNDKTVPIDVKMIDFQLSRFASPALDISFFIYSCTTKELREKHFDELLKAYHISLGEQLAVVGLNVENVFPFKALLGEMYQRACFGVGMGIESIPFSMFDDDETGDLDSVTGTEAVDVTNLWKVRPIKSKEGRLRLADMFDHAVKMGYI